MARNKKNLNELHARQSDRWRDPRQVINHGWYPEADPELLQCKISKEFVTLLEKLQITLVVSLEYDHLLFALSVEKSLPRLSYWPVPHPSGMAVKDHRDLYVTMTRNPNQVCHFRPARSRRCRTDDLSGQAQFPVLVPNSTHFYPGCSYMHDLAFIGNTLYANSVGQNAVLDLGKPEQEAWWPLCVDQSGSCDSRRNYIQLNGIAAGADLSSSFFTASAAKPLRGRYPGKLNFPVNERGVIFSGASREVVVSGLTRPHSPRLDEQGRLWVLNSGYGQLCQADFKTGRPMVVAGLPGWTRGLHLVGDIGFVGTSRIIAKFKCYAPGLDVAHCLCGVHAVDLKSGRILGQAVWPSGNQIFAVESLSPEYSLPLKAGARKTQRLDSLFYNYIT